MNHNNENENDKTKLKIPNFFNTIDTQWDDLSQHIDDTTKALIKQGRISDAVIFNSVLNKVGHLPVVYFLNQKSSQPDKLFLEVISVGPNHLVVQKDIDLQDFVNHEAWAETDAANLNLDDLFKGDNLNELITSELQEEIIQQVVVQIMLTTYYELYGFRDELVEMLAKTDFHDYYDIDENEGEGK